MADEQQKPFLILGGGLIGLAIAYELARKGKTVEVLSKNRNEAAGFVAAGMLAPHAEGLKNDLLKLGQVSLEKIPKWIEQIEADSGIACGLQTCGIIVPFVNAEERERYPTKQFGEKLNRVQLEKEIEGIASTWKVGLLFQQDGQIDNRRLLMRALEKACVQKGVHFQEGVEVLEIVQKENNFEGVKINNPDGRTQLIQGSGAVLCSGAWSRNLLKELPIFPVKGQMLSLQGPQQTLKRILFGHGTYLVPRQDGLIIVGATIEKDAHFQTGLTPEGQRELKEGIESLIPSVNHLPQMERWWGFRPCTPDEAPILGLSSLKGLWLATGHHRNGVLLAAITTDLISKSIFSLLSNEENKLLLKFSWSRFKA